MDYQQRVQSVVTAHQVLEALSTQPTGVSLTELSRLLNMTASRVLRHLGTLVELQLVERTGAEPLYRLGIGLVRLGERASVQHDVSRIAFPAVKRLNDRFGDATFLVRRQGDRAQAWLSLPSTGVPQLTMPPGMSLSLTGSVAGRVLLAFGGGPVEHLPLGTEPKWDEPEPIRTPALLDARLARIRKRLFDQHGVDQSNAIFGLSVPILNHEERAVAALTMVGFSVRLRMDDAGDAILQALMEGGADVSRQLGSSTVWPDAPARKA